VGRTTREEKEGVQTQRNPATGGRRTAAPAIRAHGGGKKGRGSRRSQKRSTKKPKREEVGKKKDKKGRARRGGSV